jgi:hypothetical protein
MMLYNISRQHKITKEFHYLSLRKKRWLPGKSKHKFCVMTEDETNDFIHAKGNDPVYYFFRTHRIK